MKKIISLMLAGALYSPVAVAEILVRNIQDVLPDTATLFMAEFTEDHTEDHDDTNIIEETQGDQQEPMTWHPYEEPVSCKKIDVVHFWPDDEGKSGAHLQLVNCQYGCNYYPRPQKPKQYWLSPGMWIEPITEKQAKILAAHCHADFVKRQ